ncbi:hypothetical protein [Fulvivirga sp.]|uniref:hypothetical protein n=1 Tax=Fulvivirga sp. TaxID=1931237 RepID=UPI0032ECF7DF
MEKVIGKELISHLLKLEKHQQEKVLDYIKDMLTNQELNVRADDSEHAIASGRVKNFEQFNTSFENWKIQKRANTK